MGRKTDPVKLNRIMEVIREKPNLLASEIAREANISHMAMLRALSQLEERGDLLQEYKDRISVFKR